MSAGLSPSGVASLRAKFEQKDESTSPPSRGRSPAASLSISGGASRPISKVRTSFVSVEPSGQMGDLDASEEPGHNKAPIPSSDGTVEAPVNGASEKPKTNGIQFTSQESAEKKESAIQAVETEDASKKDPALPNNSEILNGAATTANPDKPMSTAEDNPVTMLPSDPKEVAAVSGEAPQEGEASPLGSILKGSPFEQGEKKAETSNDAKTEMATEPAQAVDQQITIPSTPITNDKPTEGSAQKVVSPSSTKTKPRSFIGGKRPPAQLASSTTKRSANKPQTSTLSSPTTPNDTATPSKRLPTDNNSPLSGASIELKKEALGGVKKSTGEGSNQATAAPKASIAGSKRRPRPPESFAKPRPKSPTRPVRLPGSATAPTAASAAKLDTAPNTTAKTKPRVSSNPTSQRQKPARTSLPVGSKPVEKAIDKSKPRLSTVSSKASEGSFLDRMMRPTQSSSQKTHDKVETKSPPKKTSGSRPKRKSDESEKAKSGEAKARNEEPKAKSDRMKTRTTTTPPPPPLSAAAAEAEAEASSPLVPAPTEPSDSPKVNGADNGGTQGDASASPASVPVPVSLQ